MLRKIKQDEIDTAVNLAYSLSLDPSTNSYQLCKSKNEFLRLFERTFNSQDDELLGYFLEKELIAVFSLGVLRKDLYLQTYAFFIKEENETVMSVFIKYLETNYSGFEIYIGFPKENERSINYLLNQGYKMTDSSTDMRLKRNEFIPSNLNNRIVKVNEDHFSEFATFHDSKAGDIYWNSKRIKEHSDMWMLYSYWSDSELKATIATKKIKNIVEIFALLIDEEIKNMGIEEDLITASVIEGFNDPKLDHAILFIESDDQDAEEYCKKLGFSIYSHYRCLYKKL